MLPLVPGRLAQRESASFTPRRSLVRPQYRPRAGATCLLPFGQLRRGPLYLPGGRAPGPRNWWLRFGDLASAGNGFRSPQLVVAVGVQFLSRVGLRRSADCVGSRRASPGGLDPRGPRDSWHPVAVQLLPELVTQPVARFGLSVGNCNTLRSHPNLPAPLTRQLRPLSSNSTEAS